MTVVSARLPDDLVQSIDKTAQYPVKPGWKFAVFNYRKLPYI